MFDVRNVLFHNSMDDSIVTGVCVSLSFRDKTHKVVYTDSNGGHFCLDYDLFFRSIKNYPGTRPCFMPVVNGVPIEFNDGKTFWNPEQNKGMYL
jgi:hypothetical protein